MSNLQALQQLFPPISIGGVNQDDLTAEAAPLDDAQAAADALLTEMFPDSTESLVERFETLLQIVPTTGQSLADRQRIVTALWTAKGSISIPWFEAMAAALGYDAYIRPYIETMPDWVCADDEFLEEPWIRFGAGVGRAGQALAYSDPVLPWCWKVVIVSQPAVLPSPTFEQIVMDRKPAHYFVTFTYL